MQYLYNCNVFIKDKTRMQEEKLSELCKKKNTQAQKTIYELYSPYMLGVCLRYVSQRDIAEDIMHDGFIKVFSSFNKFEWRGKGSLKAWIARIMVNLSIEFLRKQKTWSCIDNHNDIISEEPPDENNVNKIPKEILISFISQLPSGYRTVFNLYVFEEKSHKEIAQILGINEKSSSSQLLRAKQSLAKKINQYIKSTK